jgi:hypothetical protein
MRSIETEGAAKRSNAAAAARPKNLALNSVFPY